MLFIDIKRIAQKRLVANDSQLNDSISPESWVEYVNESYNKVLMDWQTKVPREVKVESYDDEWPEGELTFELPVAIRESIIHQIVLVNTEGVPVGTFPGYFEKKNVLRVPVGFSVSEFPLRFYYIPVAEKWTSIDDVGSSPLFVPDRHCPLIVWETLILAKSIADREIPDRWEIFRQQAEFLFFKENMARPQATGASIKLPGAPLLRPIV